MKREDNSVESQDVLHAWGKTDGQCPNVLTCALQSAACRRFRRLRLSTRPTSDRGKNDTTAAEVTIQSHATPDVMEKISATWLLTHSTDVFYSFTNIYELLISHSQSDHPVLAKDHAIYNTYRVC